MEADFSVELGSDDPDLELPWAAPGGPQYYDLKHHPELLVSLEEVKRAPELGDFLTAINASGALETAKCDVWISQVMNPEEDVFDARCKYCSYVDLFFSDHPVRASFPRNEQFASRVTQLLKGSPHIPAAAEFLLRRCFWSSGNEASCGVYVTYYQFGYGDDPAAAKNWWAIGLKLTENALEQALESRPAGG